MDGDVAAADAGAVLGGIAGHSAFELAQQAIRVGDDWRDALRAGDPFEQALSAAVLAEADRQRVDDLVAVTRAQGVVAGQMVALSLGADPKAVQAWGAALLGGEAE